MRLKRHSALLVAGIVAMAGLAVQGAPAAKPTKTTICHRTLSAKKPYVKLTVTKSVLKGHIAHPGDIIPAPPGACPGTVLTPTRGGVRLSANLTGAAEVPGPASAAHIHVAPAGVAGPVVVPLITPDADGSVAGCVSAPRALIKQILKNPTGYYVNVHTSDYSAGAIRGQLS
jgi:hypothetical protein